MLYLWSTSVRTSWANWNDCKTSASTSLLGALVQLQSMSSNIGVGLSSITTETCTALQESRHGLRGVICKELTALQAAQQNTLALPHLWLRNRTAELLHRLRRKPWTSRALSAAFEVSGINYFSHSPAWIPQELHDEELSVIINFNRDCRVWPPEAANSAFSQLLSDINSGTDTTVETA